MPCQFLPTTFVRASLGQPRDHNAVSSPTHSGKSPIGISSRGTNYIAGSRFERTTHPPVTERIYGAHQIRRGTALTRSSALVARNWMTAAATSSPLVCSNLAIGCVLDRHHDRFDRHPSCMASVRAIPLELRHLSTTTLAGPGSDSAGASIVPGCAWNRSGIRCRLRSYDQFALSRKTLPVTRHIRSRRIRQ
jgi:hypothetical protein